MRTASDDLCQITRGEEEGPAEVNTDRDECTDTDGSNVLAEW